MKLELPSPLPFTISTLSNGCYFSGEATEGILKVPVYEEEMKYFYSNYKDYYYLPAEDVALHKSVAAFVDKDHRVQAAAANCYTRKYAVYLPPAMHSICWARWPRHTDRRAGILQK